MPYLLYKGARGNIQIFNFNILPLDVQVIADWWVIERPTFVKLEFNGWVGNAWFWLLSIWLPLGILYLLRVSYKLDILLKTMVIVCTEYVFY